MTHDLYGAFDVKAKKLVVIVGQKKAVAIAVRSVSGRRDGRSCMNG